MYLKYFKVIDITRNYIITFQTGSWISKYLEIAHLD